MYLSVCMYVFIYLYMNIKIITIEVLLHFWLIRQQLLWDHDNYQNWVTVWIDFYISSFLRKITPNYVVAVYSLNHVWLFCNPMGCSPSGPSVHGIFQARILEWISISFFRGSSWLTDQTHISCIGRWIRYHWAIREASLKVSLLAADWFQQPSSLGLINLLGWLTLVA